MSCIRGVGITSVADAVDDGMEIRPTCSTKGCSAPARRRSGRCARCYWKRWYSANKMELLAERRSMRHAAGRVRGPRVSARFNAMQALSAAQVGERRVTALMTQLGLNASDLPRDEPSIRILLDEIRGPITHEQLDARCIRHYGGVFFGMNETYLEAIGLLIKSKEPWMPFCDFANRLTSTLHRESAQVLARSEELQLAANYLSRARAHLWRISYLLCQRMHGTRTADQVLGEKPSAVSELASLLR